MNRITTTAAAAVLVLGAVMLNGCRDEIMAPDAGIADPLPAQAYPDIVALEGLGKYLAFGEPVRSGGPGERDPLSVQVPVRIMSDHAVNIQYRYEFFDKAGRIIDPKMDWRFLKLPARAQLFIEGSALDTNADRWRLLVRPAR